jgi:nucleotide-binding universal stress UspA family protein
MDANHLAQVLPTQHLPELLPRARAASELEVERASAGERPPPVDVVQALTIADGLEAARVAHRADGIIIARVARRESLHLFRLGDVGRRLLRRLASPIVVVPPVFGAPESAAGPVVALSSLGDDSLPACRVASRIASSTGREIVFAHVGASADAGAALGRWSEEHEIWPDATAVLDGDAAAAPVAYAEGRRAVLLAVGASPPSGLRRVLGPKLVTRLAAIAETPLLVVPAHFDAGARAAVETEAEAPQPAPGPHESAPGP